MIMITYFLVFNRQSPKDEAPFEGDKVSSSKIVFASERIKKQIVKNTKLF